MRFFKIFVAVLLIGLIGNGCRDFEKIRLNSYRVTPVTEEQLEHIRLGKEYSVIKARISSLLVLAERGFAWELILRKPDGELERTFATQLKYYDEQKKAEVFLADDDSPLAADRSNLGLYAILPYGKKELADMRAIIISHDQTWCVGLDGQDIGYCDPESEKFAWEKIGSKPANFATNVAVQTPSDEEVLAWLKKAQENDLIKLENFGLTVADFDRIKNSGLPWWHYFMKVVLPTGTTILSTSLIMNPVAGAISAAIVGGASGIEVLVSSLTSADLDHPEFMHGKATNKRVAEAMIQAANAMSATARQYALAIQEQLQMEMATMRKDMEYMKERIKSMETTLEEMKRWAAPDPVKEVDGVLMPDE